MASALLPEDAYDEGMLLEMLQGDVLNPELQEAVVAGVVEMSLPYPTTPDPLNDASQLAPGMVADGGSRDWKDLQLIISQHSVHKVEEDEVTNQRTYVVSNLRKFQIGVELLDRNTNELVPNQLQLQVESSTLLPPPPSSCH